MWYSPTLVTLVPAPGALGSHEVAMGMCALVASPVALIFVLGQLGEVGRRVRVQLRERATRRRAVAAPSLAEVG